MTANDYDTTIIDDMRRDHRNPYNPQSYLSPTSAYVALSKGSMTKDRVIAQIEAGIGFLREKREVSPAKLNDLNVRISNLEERLTTLNPPKPIIKKSDDPADRRKPAGYMASNQGH